MMAWALGIAVLATSLALLLNLWRLAAGPDTVDRVLALDTMVVNAIALIVLMGIGLGSTLAFEGALLFAMTGFVTTVAFCKFLLRGDVID
ncbi:MAG TPA: K+/H+ antiporter subunit F [Geminicoccaceae bacterium]|nr:K+/H+ antiporter subunit F [Geminicoccus sp.]HMU49828.1 K+/H+ antiporter subunit F [Geminicoccaceae bacterium]